MENKTKLNSSRERKEAGEIYVGAAIVVPVHSTVVLYVHKELRYWISGGALHSSSKVEGKEIQLWDIETTKKIITLLYSTPTDRQCLCLKIIPLANQPYRLDDDDYVPHMLEL